MSVDLKSPWRVVIYGNVCETCSAEERTSQIRNSTDRPWLRRVAAWPGSQRTVIEAANRRLRVLDRKKRR